MTYRIFIALNLPVDIKRKLSFLTQELEKNNQHLKIKWVEEINFHLTLHFLGDLSRQQIQRVDQILNSIVRKIKPLKLFINSINGFPNLNYPQTIFCDVQEISQKQILKLQKEIGQELIKKGFKIDQRPWQSHITLGRNKKRAKFKSLDYDLPELNFEIDKIDLMKSQLTSHGPIYSIVKEYYFK